METEGARVRVVDDEGRRALMVDGVVVSVAVKGDEVPSGYWAAMLPTIRPRSALMLGLGGGTLAHLLNVRCVGIEMVGVDADAEVVSFAQGQFGLELPNLSVVVADAFEYVARCERGFDFVAVDLFRGYDMQRGLQAKPFLRRLRSIVGDQGEVVFNLFQDRRTSRHLTRIGRVLKVWRVDEIGKNVVAHCRA